MESRAKKAAVCSYLVLNLHNLMILAYLWLVTETRCNILIHLFKVSNYKLETSPCSQKPSPNPFQATIRVPQRFLRIDKNYPKPIEAEDKNYEKKNNCWLIKNTI